MLKVDVAIQSYKKPESLLYTLMCLKECSGDRIDTVYINDDCSGPDAKQLYTGNEVREYFKGWNIRFRQNTRRIESATVTVKGYRPSYTSPARHLCRLLGYMLWHRRSLPTINDVRYQWALNSTDKEFVFLTHDDVDYTGDIVGLYLDSMTPDTAIVGDLGQCWRCSFSKSDDPCSPQRIMHGELPWQAWPLTDNKSGQYNKRACRINEWCCMIQTSAAQELVHKEKCFLGNFDDGGDTGAYWFEKAIKHGYRICDPLPSWKLRTAYYQHCWQGHPGAHVRRGVVAYKRDFILKRTRERFGCTLVPT